MESILEYFQGKKPKATARGEVDSPDVIDPSLQQQQKVQQVASPVAPATPMGQLTSQVKDVVKKAADQSESDFVSEPTIGDRISSGLSKVGKFVDENPAFLMGATPVLMGFLSGEPQVGYEVGAKALFDEASRREKRLEELRKAEAKRLEKASTDKAQMKTLYNKETGEEVAVNYDPVTRTLTDFNGNPIDMAKYSAKMPLKEQLDIKRQSSIDEYVAKGQHLSPYQDPVTKEKGFINKLTLAKQMVPTKREFNAFQINHIENERKKLKDTDKVIDGFRDVSEALRSLRSNGVIGKKAALVKYAKYVQGQGQRLSDFDVQFLTTAFGGLEAAFDWIKKTASGNVDRLDRELAKGLSNSLATQRKRVKELYDRSYSSGDLYNISPDQMKKYIGNPVGLYDRAIIEFEGIQYPVNIEDLESIMQKKEFKKAKVIGYE